MLFTEDQSQALLVLTAPPRSEGYEKLQLLAVLGPERFAGASPLPAMPVGAQLVEPAVDAAG